MRTKPEKVAFQTALYTLLKLCYSYAIYRFTRIQARKRKVPELCIRSSLIYTYLASYSKMNLAIAAQMLCTRICNCGGQGENILPVLVSQTRFYLSLSLFPSFTCNCLQVYQFNGWMKPKSNLKRCIHACTTRMTDYIFTEVTHLKVKVVLFLY